MNKKISEIKAMAKCNGRYNLLILLFCILTTLNLYGQEVSSQVYHISTDTIYVLTIECIDEKEHYFEEVSVCGDSIKSLLVYGVQNLPSFFLEKIPENGIDIGSRIKLYRKANSSNERIYSDDIILYIGEVNPTKINFCAHEKLKMKILAIAKFLKDRNYAIETSGELTESLKKGMKQYCTDKGLPVHVMIYNLVEIFEIDIEEIETKFCECMNI